MANIKVPYLKLRNGRPRWEPGGKGGARLRAAGFPGRDLKGADGQWLGLEAAIAAAGAINAEVAAWRAGGRQRLVPAEGPPGQRRPERCCERVFELYWKSPAFADDIAARTRIEYRHKQRVFLGLRLDPADANSRRIGDCHIKAITKPVMYGLWEELRRTRGHTAANGLMRSVSTVMTYAEKKGWRDANSNPCLALNLPQPPERLALWLPSQVDAMLATADAEQAAPLTHSIGDALIVGLHTGQRLGDVLAMPDRIFERERIALTQAKRGALVDVKMTPQVAARVAAIRARRQVGAGEAVARIGGALILNEKTGQAYASPTQFNTRWREVRARAAEQLGAIAADARWDGPHIYQLAELTYHDLRDTCVTRLALAGCTIPQIAAITGHSLSSITSIMKHYLALNRAMADAATDLVVAWLQREGIAV